MLTNSVRSVILAGALLWNPCLSVAGPAAQALSTCLTDSTTGKERKSLARWIFIAMSAHPEIKELATVSPAQAEASSKETAELMVSLIADRCPSEVRTLIKEEGPQAIQAAFEFLGKAAFQELITSPEVVSSIGQLQKYVDSAKIQAAVAPR